MNESMLLSTTPLPQPAAAAVAAAAVPHGWLPADAPVLLLIALVRDGCLLLRYTCAAPAAPAALCTVYGVATQALSITRSSLAAAADPGRSWLACTEPGLQNGRCMLVLLQCTEPYANSAAAVAGLLLLLLLTVACLRMPCSAGMLR
jgi:hypothetical protein